MNDPLETTIESGQPVALSRESTLSSDRLYVFALLAIICQLVVPTMGAMEYELHGYLRCDRHMDNHIIVAYESRCFQVKVRDSHWWIQSIQTLTNATPAVFELASTNSPAFFQLTHPSVRTNAPQDPQAIVSVDPKTKKTNAIPANNKSGVIATHKVAIITPLPVPAGCMDMTMPHLWLMFASHQFFKDNTNHFITPVYDLETSWLQNPAYKLEADWILASGEPRLPISIKFLNSGQWPTRNNDGTTGFLKLPPPCDQGFTNATYRTTGFTNLNGLTLPTGFIFEHYLPFGSGTNGGLLLSSRVVATVTEFKTVCSRTNMLPNIAGRTVVIDYRLPFGQVKGQRITYNNTKNRWLTVDEVKEIAEQRAKRSTGNKSKSMLVALFIVLALAPVVIIAVTNRKAGRATGGSHGRPTDKST